MNKLLYNKFTQCFVFFIFLISYCYTDELGLVNNIIKLFSVMMSIAIVVVYFFNNKISKFVLTIVGFMFVSVVSSFLANQNYVYNVLKVFYRIIAISCYMDMGIKYKPRKLVNSMYYVFYSIILINFYTILKYPEGLYSSEYYDNNWFLGYDNTHICFYIPAVLLLLIRKYYNKKIKFVDIVLLCIITYCVFFCFSANSVVTFSLLLLYIIFEKFVDSIKIVNIKSNVIVNILFFFGIVVLRMQDAFEWFIVGILGKKLTFTGRTKIWDNVMKYIKEKPIFGYGKEPITTVADKLGNSKFTHAHNTILDVLYKSGILGLISFGIMIYFPSSKLNKNMDNQLAKMMNVVLFCYLFMSNFEARQEKIGLYIILILCYNVELFIKSVKGAESNLNEN